MPAHVQWSGGPNQACGTCERLGRPLSLAAPDRLPGRSLARPAEDLGVCSGLFVAHHTEWRVRMLLATAYRYPGVGANSKFATTNRREPSVAPIGATLSATRITDKTCC